jgi:hypothetical protein
MIEFNCFTPPAFVAQTLNQRIETFEAFWESECPRFGDAVRVDYLDLTVYSSARTRKAGRIAYLKVGIPKFTNPLFIF